MHVPNGANSPADGKRHETLIRRALNDTHHGVPALGAGSDVEKDHFISALLVITNGQFDRVTNVLQFTGFGFAKLNATGNVTCVHVQAGNDSSS